MPRRSASILVPLQDRGHVKFSPFLLPHSLQVEISGVIINELNRTQQSELLLRGCIPAADLHPAVLCQVLSLVAPA